MFGSFIKYGIGISQEVNNKGLGLTNIKRRVSVCKRKIRLFHRRKVDSKY
jgi:hypothetical protein